MRSRNHASDECTAEAVGERPRAAAPRTAPTLGAVAHRNSLAELQPVAGLASAARRGCRSNG